MKEILSPIEVKQFMSIPGANGFYFLLIDLICHLAISPGEVVQIANLMLQAADVLLLDEPTNDLDIPTLEVLESSLQDFPGAIVLISHDRYMLDQISNVILGLGTETDEELFADYRQWEQHQLQKSQLAKEAAKESVRKKEASPKRPNEPEK